MLMYMQVQYTVQVMLAWFTSAHLVTVYTVNMQKKFCIYAEAIAHYYNQIVIH